jgi:hypothetical protein
VRSAISSAPLFAFTLVLYVPSGLRLAEMSMGRS